MNSAKADTQRVLSFLGHVTMSERGGRRFWQPVRKSQQALSRYSRSSSAPALGFHCRGNFELWGHSPFGLKLGSP